MKIQTMHVLMITHEMNNMKAKELNAYLRHLTLAGRNEEGELEWIGTPEDWSNLQVELNQEQYETQI